MSFAKHSASRAVMRLCGKALLFIALFGSATVSGQNQCTMKLAELPAAPELLGFHPGMTKEEVKLRVPQTVFGRTDDFGISKTTINPDFDPLIDKTRFEGVRSVSLDFLDGRLTSLWIGYDSSFKVQTIDSFIRAITQSLRLPNAWTTWRSRGQQMRCADFQMTVTIVAGGPSFRILDQAAEDTVASRREAKEQETVAAENATAVTPETADVIGDRLTKTYYTAGCQPAKITEVNRVTFKSTDDAEKAGFKAARNCH